MAERLPAGFGHLERFVQTWCLPSGEERYLRRLETPMEDLVDFYDAVMPTLEKAIACCDTYALNDMPEQAVRLLQLVHSAVVVAMAVEIWHQPRVINGGDAVLDRVAEPLP